MNKKVVGMLAMIGLPKFEVRRNAKEKVLGAWDRKFRSMAVVSVVTLAMAFSTANADMVIVYDFEGNTAAATTNDFEDEGLDVTAGDIQTSNTHGGMTGINNERWQRKLLGGSPTTMSFLITIPENVTIDLTKLEFLFGMDSRQGTNDTWSQWDLTIFQDGVEVENSASPNSSGPVYLEGTSSNDYYDQDETVTLSGLTGLTDTEIEFAFVVNYATSPDLTGGNNNSRHAFLDDITLTGVADIPPEGTLIILL